MALFEAKSARERMCREGMGFFYAADSAGSFLGYCTSDGSSRAITVAKGFKCRPSSAMKGYEGLLRLNRSISLVQRVVFDAYYQFWLAPLKVTVLPRLQYLY